MKKFSWYNSEFKNKCKDLYLQGKSCNEISRILNCGKSTVQRFTIDLPRRQKNSEKVRCVKCNHRTDGFINADHIKPFALIMKENNITNLQEAIKCKELWDINNGRTLCIDHHKMTETWGSKSWVLLKSNIQIL